MTKFDSGIFQEDTCNNDSENSSSDDKSEEILNGLLSEQNIKLAKLSKDRIRKILDEAEVLQVYVQSNISSKYIV
jgi:hypothetical protein